MKGREPTNVKKPHATSVDTEKINKYYDKLSTVRRIITPQFNAYKPRYTKDQQLPSFMEVQSLYRKLIAELVLPLRTWKCSNSMDSLKVISKPSYHLLR